MRSSKSEVRESILKIRNNLDSGIVIMKSREIQKRLRPLDIYKNAQTILFYAATKKEVQTKEK